MLTQTRAGVLLALGATVGWSANILFSRMLAEQVPPFTLSLLRSLVALVAFAPFTYKAFLRAWPIIRARPGFYILMSLTGLGYYNSMVYMAGRTTTVVNMSLLATSSPVFTLLLSRFFLGDPLTPRRILGILAAVCGIALLTTRGDLALLLGLRFYIGDVYMIAASLIFACYTVGIRKKDPDLDNNPLILTTFIVSCIFLLPMSAWEFASGGVFLVTTQSVIGILYLGLIASIFCYICWTNAIARIGPGNTALIYYLLPVFSGIEAVLILGEPVLWVHFAGGGLIIAGVLTATRN